MLLGFLHVFPNANKGVKSCAVCGADIPHKMGYVHHFKLDRRMNDLDIKPPKPMNKAWAYFTHQMYFCSEACVLLKGLSGIYEERRG